ncbi:MAG: polysaccharide deacetylase family protein [Planctomycetes bacterium]|nr:polysaccharide deacetylase family protein [Planctomycetota bacterium]
MDPKPVILSFDVEEHYRIESAAGYDCPALQRDVYSARMETTTRKLLDLLADYDVRATFFIVGRIAESHPRLVRDIHAAGHEVASHSWEHRRVHHFTPATFAEDLHKSKDALEQATGMVVQGYRAPTFSVVRETGWAIDVLAEAGFQYDSSIFPVRHDRYGIADAPRSPFLAIGSQHRLFELPPVTLRWFNFNIPVAGGGYFRLFPLGILEAGIRQANLLQSPAAMLYFHPWEFDPDQPRLPLSRLSGFRTYVGTQRSFSRLRKLLTRHRFQRAIDVVEQLKGQTLPEFRV